MAANSGEMCKGFLSPLNLEGRRNSTISGSERMFDLWKKRLTYKELPVKLPPHDLTKGKIRYSISSVTHMENSCISPFPTRFPPKPPEPRTNTVCWFSNNTFPVLLSFVSEMHLTDAALPLSKTSKILLYD